jgi:hypothetical protein
MKPECWFDPARERQPLFYHFGFPSVFNLFSQTLGNGLGKSVLPMVVKLQNGALSAASSVADASSALASA